jgi:fructoselysine-6-P-deglycase FrlB-like protein
MPELIQSTIDRREGFDDVAAVLRRPEVGRIVVSGNGASYYAAHMLWLAALANRQAGKSLVTVPAGLLAGGAFEWREGDALVAVSSSGELRDLVELTGSRQSPRPLAVITADAHSSLAKAADACAIVPNPRQRAITHTQAFCGAVVACLDIWGRLTRSQEMLRATSDAPGACARAITGTSSWFDRLQGIPDIEACVAFGTGMAWAAALESALLLKEIARIPSEGAESREAATSSMTAAGPNQLVLSLPSGLGEDRLANEARTILESRGATVVEVSAGLGEERLLSPIVTFPPVVALSVALARRRELDVDKPAWIDAYYETARVAVIASDGRKAHGDG